MKNPFCEEDHVEIGTDARFHLTDAGWEGCKLPTASESYRTLEPCGHTSNFLIGDERGNFSCTVCRMDAAEAALRDRSHGFSDWSG